MKGKEEMVGSCLLSSVMRAKIGREHPLSVERFVFKKKKNKLVKSWLSFCLERKPLKYWRGWLQQIIFICLILHSFSLKCLEKLVFY